MKKHHTLRGTAAVALATAGLFASIALPAGAAASTFKVDAIMANDLHVKNVPTTKVSLGGSSFDANLVLAAEQQFAADNPRGSGLATYDTTKSGTGRANAISGAYNVGFSDFPLNIASSGEATASDYVQVPVALGGVGIIFNLGTLPSATQKLLAKNPLVLSGPVLGKIFAGTITKWNDPLIAALNPKLVQTVAKKKVTALPDLAIKVESRTDGSGTTFIFKDYLSKVDNAQFASADSNHFSVAVAQNSNSSALDGAVTALAGSIGYVEYGYAVASGNTMASVVNAAGKALQPTAAGLTAAATAGLTAIGTFSTASVSGFSINNAPGATSYPIAGFSYAIAKKTQTDLNTAVTIVKFLDFLVHQGGGMTLATTFGQDLATTNGYAPLPASLQTVARNILLQVKVGGTAVLNETN